MTITSIQNNQPLAVCLHASGQSSSQWEALREEIGTRMRFVAPDLLGYSNADRYRRGTRLSLDQEVQHVLRQIKAETGKDNGPLHLVGHAYGAAVALQLALTCPERVASLTLYEPAQFLLLFSEGLQSEEGREILALLDYMKANIGSPLRRWSAARKFVDFWSGTGSWNQMKFGRKCRFAILLPTVTAELQATLSARLSSANFAEMHMPVRLITGSDTRSSMRKVSDELASALPNAEQITVNGANHMAPVASQQQLAPLFAGHVFATLERHYAAVA
jgi:pimeloyl-ACP methyl ester carboxylesterase